MPNAMRQLVTLPALLLFGVLCAQDCDSIRVDSIRYAPFGDGLQVSLYNANTQFLNGPLVDVWNTAGDTLGRGAPEFFGVMQGPSLHQVHFTPQPPTPFSGTVVLHYNDENGMAQCELAVEDLDLCPPAGCVAAMVFAYQQGGNPVPMELVWSLEDVDNALVSNGVLAMDGTGFGFVTHELCLLPGAYTLHMEQPVAAGTNIQVGMTQAGFAYTDGVTIALPSGSSIELPFDYYLHCADGTQGIASPQPSAPTVTMHGHVLRVASRNGEALDSMVVLDPMGRVVRSINNPGTLAMLDLSGLPSGAYLLAPSAGKKWSTQRFVRQ